MAARPCPQASANAAHILLAFSEHLGRRAGPLRTGLSPATVARRHEAVTPAS
jgi:hypothetical protein